MGACFGGLPDFEDYNGASESLEWATDALTPGDRVLVLDDWSETGSPLRASVSLIERLGGKIVGIPVVHGDKRVLDDPLLSRYSVHSALA